MVKPVIDDEWLADLTEMIEYAANKIPKSETFGRDLSQAVKRIFVEKYGGEELYVKKGRPVHPDAERIKADFNGQNVEQVMERYGVSRATVYRYANSKG